MTILGKYELLEELGRGGFGTVYRARDTILDVERAVKILHPPLAASPEFIERFRREGRIAARLEHPNIIPVYELGEIGGSYYLVMKYLPGGSLKDLLEKDGPLRFTDAVEIIHQVADALIYAYNQPEKLIHRDLKPGNILFEKRTTGETKASVRLSDFGFAKALADTNSSSSASGGMLGTPAYMAPEIWRGEAASPATDQYALACVLYEMLTGKVLFTGSTPPEIMTKHMLYGPQFPQIWPNGLPNQIVDIFRRALATKPEERYASMAAFYSACADLLAYPTTFVATPTDEKISVPSHPKSEPEQSIIITPPPHTNKPLTPETAETQSDETSHTVTQHAQTKSTQQPAWELGVKTTPTITKTPLRREVSSSSSSVHPQSSTQTIGWMWAVAAGLFIVMCLVVWNGGLNRSPLSPTDAPTESKIALPTWAGVVQKTVKAENGWIDTDILVTKGQYWSINYLSGRWSPCKDSCSDVDANGLLNEVESLNNGYNVVLNCYHAALVAQIGDSDPLCIKNNFLAVADDTGLLRLSINDTNLVDNGGEITVQIDVGSTAYQGASPTSEPVVTAEDSTPTLTPYPISSCQEGKVCIRWFVGLGTGTDQTQIAIEEEVVKDFNDSHDKIQLILEIVPYAAARDTLATEIASDNAPDIVGPAGWGSSSSFYNLWADLGPLIEKSNFDTSIFNPALVRYYQVEGRQEGLPFAVFPGAIYFVPSLFDESGLAYPPQSYGQKYHMPDGSLVDWNWDAVTQIAKLLTVDKNGKNSTEEGFDRTQIVQIGYNAQWQSPLSVATFYAGAEKIYSGNTTGEYRAIFSDNWKNAWKWYYDAMWGAQPFMPTGALAGSPEFGAGNVFNSGKAAMALSQTWYLCCVYDLVQANYQFQLGIQPMGADGKVHGRIDADTFRMLQSTKHPDEAFEVMAYLLTTGADKLLPSYGAMPAIASKTGSFFASKKQDFPFVTDESWNVFLQGLAYPDTPSSEQYQPNWNEATTRQQMFLDLMNNTDPSQFDFEAEYQKLIDDLNIIYNK